MGNQCCSEKVDQKGEILTNPNPPQQRSLQSKSEVHLESTLH